ncbi:MULTISPECIES: hypothetical protein [Flavobacteriaceae]|uniref:hypothetical protein n=1 Tax=Flavobacteriaceae TaxID=49546 RepID=UPI001492632F|nr:MULTISPECIES: hypothetical protein [Allomuricauda]MDC6364833.1 hypothetical protein [Muricauda sp. AC10]
MNKKISCLKLYRNDIDKYIDTYKNEGYAVSFYDNDYKYQSLDDYLDNHGNLIKKLTVEFNLDDDFRGTTIEFEDNTMSIYSPNRLDLSTPIYEHALKKKWVASYILRPQNILFLFIPYIIVMIAIAIIIPEPEDLSLAELLNRPFGMWMKYGAIGIASFTVIAWLYQRYILGFSLEKVHKTGFNRYRSQIIVGVCVAIITFLITKLFDWLTN